MSTEHPGGRKPNRLINEQSPYLRQHAYNPVDWFPWGPEALDKARRENKPILLSIGYSACHWCHVMERESFENENIARVMNTLFVPIKVDREERPDLDQIYMDAVQLFAGRGGWPLTMFLTPDCKPFFGGTYFPPSDRQGMPGFPRVLSSVADAYNNRIEDVNSNTEKLTKALGALSEYEPTDGELSPRLVATCAEVLAEHYDRVNGGLGQAPKFPNTFVFSLFLRVFHNDDGAHFGDMVAETLTKMAKGGIYDQIGGGFHRYSVDARWLVPHFEKMLYDNALLSRLYLDAARALDRPDFLEVAGEIFDYVLREMTSPEGGFYATQDADSEGVEGKFFVWQLDAVREELGPELAPIAERYFDISEEGNFEEANILHRTISVEDTAKLFGKSEAQISDALETIRKKLFAAREKRIKPGRDEKILAAWNGMMISALAEGFRVLGEQRYLDAAVRGAEFVMSKLWDGRALQRSFKDGVARFNGYLEDYALMANALVDLYEATFEPRFLEKARRLLDVIIARFEDAKNGGFFFTSDDHEQLITRTKPAFDGSTPSGNSETLAALLRIHAYSGDAALMDKAQRGLKLFREFIEKQPFAFSRMLEVVDLYQHGPTEIVLVGDRQSEEFRHWIEKLGLLYIPNRALFVVDPAQGTVGGFHGGFVPEYVRDKRQIEGRLTAYVCRNHTCSLPRTSIEELQAELRD